MNLQLVRPPPRSAPVRHAPDKRLDGQHAEGRGSSLPLDLVVEAPSVGDLAPPGLDAPWSLPSRTSPDAPDPERWFAGPAVWGARPVEPRKVDGMSLVLVAAAVALAPGAIASALFGQAWAAVLGFILAFAVGGALVCWLELRAGPTTRPDFERGVLLRDVYGLKGRFVGGTSVDGLTAGTRVVIGQNRADEVCLYANGREYPLARLELDRVRAAMGVTGRGS